MARNGSGSYVNPYPNFVSGTVISSDQVDANNSDIATALTQSIAVDGQSTVTGNIPFNSKKITGLAVGSAATDSSNLGQIQANAYAYCGTMGGSANAGTLAPTPAITAYAVGQKFFWKASTSANTGAMTVAISGLSTIAVQNDRTALAAGDHSASDIFMGILDSTSTMQLMRIANPEPLADNSVTLAKMASGVDGNIISYDASGNPVAIATGNDGQVLTSAGAGAQPAFEDAGGGGGLWVFSSSGTISSDNFQVMGFTTDIRLEINATTSQDGDNLDVRFSTDGSSFLSTNYAYQIINMTGGTFDNTYSNASAKGVATGGGIGSASGESFCWVFETMDAPNTATFIKTRTWCSFDHQGGAGAWTTGNIANKAANNLNGVKLTVDDITGTYKVWTKVTS